jgi:hypothetical protein
MLFGKPEEKKSIRSLRRIRDDNNKIYIRDIGFGDAEWIHLAQNRDLWWLLFTQ